MADIGATHARFQYCRDGVLQGAVVDLPTQNYRDGNSLLQDALSALGQQTPKHTLMAVAGPASRSGAPQGLDDEVAQNAAHRAVHQIEVTNTGLKLRTDESAQILGSNTWLVNDFYALAHGVPYFQHLEKVGGATASDATKALLGPGSGLGMATIVPQDWRADTSATQWQVIASEGGHADLAPGSHLEAELWGVLVDQHQHVSWETVLCGPGLQNLYAAMCVVWGMQPNELSAEQISAQGVDMSDPVCHQTLETFCALLGAAAGNLAVTVTATGGVYLGGGILPQMLDFVRTSPLRRRFEERGVMTRLVQDIPIFVITEAQPGLIGAARCLQRHIELAG